MSISELTQIRKRLNALEAAIAVIGHNGGPLLEDDPPPPPPETEDQQLEALTLSVPEAGRKYFGLSRNASYAAARSGALPTVKMGRLYRVPVRAMERMLDEAGRK